MAGSSLRCNRTLGHAQRHGLGTRRRSCDGERIFELFFTTKGQDGTGLGLETVLRIAKANGGGVALKSKTRSGATFKLYIPACEPAAGPVTEKQFPGGSMLLEVKSAENLAKSPRLVRRTNRIPK